jgi:hypothetical protein
VRLGVVVGTVPARVVYRFRAFLSEGKMPKIGLVQFVDLGCHLLSSHFTFTRTTIKKAKLEETRYRAQLAREKDETTWNVADLKPWSRTSCSVRPFNDVKVYRDISDDIY